MFFISMGHLGFTQIDSLNHSLKLPVDSINNIASLQWVKDSLTITTWADSMKVSLQNRFTPDSLKLKSKVDSLSSLQLPTEPFTSRLDSLLEKKENLSSEITGKQQELTSKTKSKLNQWQQSIRARLDSMGIKGNIPDVNLPQAKELNLPQTDFPDLDIPGLDLPQIPSLASTDFANLELSPDLADINTKLPFSSIVGLEGIQENLSGITDKMSVLSDLKANAAPAAESLVGELDPVKELQKQTKALEGIQPPGNPADQLPNADQAKEQLKNMAIDHFAGKDQQLKAAMQEISKYKKKYSNLQSIKDLPKKAPNPMKEKAFIERLVEGITLQPVLKDNWMVDINPSVGYRLTKRLTINMGWNYRITFGENDKEMTAVYGPRINGEYKVFKGFSGRLDVETMNAFVPANLKQSDVGQREWVPAIFLGLKKDYKIYKQLRGTAITLYNLYNPDYKSPYGDRLNIRLGFEYTIKKKKKKKGF